MRAYHFVGATLRDGREIPEDGEWLEHESLVAMCESGLHASRHPFDALQYAPGATLCLVDVEGVVEDQDDKLVARRRRIVRRVDATALLREFARWCVLQVIHLRDAPAVVREYLETGREDLRTAAWAAAWDAAWDAAWAAAWDAQRAKFAEMVNAAFGMEER
ncbi:MAG: hypothetical protein A2133_00850 [Actinobacteria bacterium RBG_16_64_13]|nr:MAG: hypothetical protein A2133_00850 [Actinobacteria bacterium RBG_16_64_13]